jgi:hypothetical protein
MFMINMPKTFKVGDTWECRINGEPEQVTWRDENTLVIGLDDARTIVTRQSDGGDLVCFICGDAGKKAGDYGTDIVGDGFVVGERGPARPG